MTVLTDVPLTDVPPQERPLPGVLAGPATVAGDVAADVAAAVHVPVCGVLDGSTVARVREVLDQAVARRPLRLVVDLTDCPFVDASALAMLLEAHRRLARSGGVLTLRGCSPRVLRLLSLTGLRRVFDLA